MSPWGTEGGATVLYINWYYEKDLTTGMVTTHYYLGGRLVAMKRNATLEYAHRDHLTGTALVTDTGGSQGGGCQSQGSLGAGTCRLSMPYDRTRCSPE